MEKAAESEDEAEFEASAGASLTFPMCAYKLKRGTAVMLKDRPCKLLTVLKVVTSKHGHAKMRLVGQDIFSDKLETQTPAGSHKVTCPFVTTATYTLLDLDEDESMLTLLNGETGELREDLAAPEDVVGEALVDAMAAREAGSDVEVTVTVTEAMGMARVTAVKVLRR